MKRRQALRHSGAFLVMLVAGCVSTTDDDSNSSVDADDSGNETKDRQQSDGKRPSEFDTPSEFESCPQRILYYSRLPPVVQAEIDIAFAKGQYETDGELFWDQIDGGAEALYYEGYYEPHVDGEDGGSDGTQTLTFYETTVTEPLSIAINTQVDGRYTGWLTVTDQDGSELRNERFEVTDESHSEINLGDVELGEYDIHVSVEDHNEANKTLPNDYFDERPIMVTIEENRLRITPPPDDGGHARCAWNEQGKLDFGG